MKRPARGHRRPYPVRRRVPRVFWRLCDRCGMMIRQEPMWVIRLSSIDYGTGEVYRYVYRYCFKCMPAADDVRWAHGRPFR